ncbi:uncharacterized protein LOC113271854 [Papaver somniferum]|uniref:uncharacterized protein LOC113271854 n=1 Tax=Papaver somniferum TaxID=3469 RepID=UPI000E7011BD|nr:uncharacterized protein LOC113271854 [Papaver somniferum]
MPTLVWKRLWKVNVSHKVKLFIWKCLKGIVPALFKISHYKTGIDTFCPHCGSHNETLEHLLYDCTYASSVWMDMNVNVSNLQTHHISVSTWIISWFTSFQAAHNDQYNNWLLILMNTAWQIWKNRCDKLFRNESPNKWITLSNIRWVIRQCENEQGQNKQVRPKNNNWKPPANNQLKINIDASFDNVTKKFGIGLIARDSAGKSRGIRGKSCNGGLDPE